MLYRDKVVSALEQKRAQFQKYSVDRQRQRVLLDEWLGQFCQQSYAMLMDKLAQSNVAWPGAEPTPEWDRANRLCLLFGQQWANHSAARAWALQILLDRSVIAVDGSQLSPSKDFSIPVGAVQIGWFINHHRQGGSYVKDVAFAILAPDELIDDAELLNDNPDSSFPNQNVNQLRFVLECEKLCALMAEHATLAEAARPLCFFDGSFIVSFVGRMQPKYARPHLQAVQQVLATSERYHVPLVAFVDSSFSHDLVTLMQIALGHTQPLATSDAGVLEQAGLLPNWGDRTPFFFCARPDKLSEGGRADFYRDVAFCYVRLTSDRPPARLEIPRWLFEAGRADEIVDLVRAECVVGAGYPYAIETADALAVISQQDRQHFYALFQQFAAGVGLPLTQARKATSKQARR